MALSLLTDAAAKVLDPGESTHEYQRYFDAAKRARLPYDKETWLNVAFYLNQQYVEWNTTTGTIQRIPRPPGLKHAPRPVSNKIMHFVQSELADVLNQRPTVDVLPASEDPGDVSKANVALAYLKWLCEPLNCDFDGVLAEAALWALAGTEGYIKWCWNPRLNDGKGRGDIVAVSPFDIYPDPYAKRFKDCRWIIHSQFMDIEQVYDIYGVALKPSDVEKADPNKVALQREMGMAPVLNGVQVHEMWMKPNRKYPKGRFAVWSHEKWLIKPCDFPYDHHRLPFTQIGSIGRPGSLHYDSAVTFLREPQMELNKIHAQMIQTREAFANPKWFIDTALEMETDPDDSPNQILRGNTNGGQLKPLLIQPTMMPPNDAGAWVVNEMQDIVGVHDVSNGQVPGRVESGNAISQLQDADDSRLSELTRSISTAITEGFYQQLMLAKQFHQGSQMVSAYSLEGIAEVHKFMASKIDPGMRIKVMMGTGLSNNRAARLQQLMVLWQNQIIRDPELMAELLEMPVSSISPSNAFDIRLARNENYTMEAGTPITPNSWDNHDIHRREHNNFRKTTEFLNLPMQVKQMFEYHVQMHDQLQMAALGQQLKIQEQAALVANGAGFQQGQAEAQQGQQASAPGQGGPVSAAKPGRPPANPAAGPAHGGVPAPHPAGTLPQIAAAGAHVPVNVDDVRNTAQGAATYLRRDAATLGR